MRTEVLIVDDHPFTRAGIRAILETNKSIEVVGEAVDGNDALIKVSELKPEIIVMDINMPNLSGIDATAEILKTSAHAKIIALSIHSGEQFVREMLDAGAVGYLLKDEAPEELLRAIKKVKKGEMFLSSGVTRAALSERKKENINILQTKLQRPPIMDDYITRHKIIDKLEAGVVKPLSVISAGAGYGKSIVVSQWLERTTSLYTWLSLDEEHNDFRTFLLYFCGAIEKIFPAAMNVTINKLGTIDLPPFKAIFNSLINEVCNIDQDFILVLDDFHLLRKENIIRFFNEWLRFPPPNVHLSIITRRDPPLNFSLLQSSGRMLEIRMDDLSLSNDEIAELFKSLLGIELKERSLKVLQDKTEGWVIGLRLTSMAINKEEDIEKMIQVLDGDMNSVMDYLVAEVLSKQPEEIVYKLVKSSVLDRFCSELIEEVTMGQYYLKQNAVQEGDFIQWLIKSNMFLIFLDVEQKWFRYHHLFQKLLQNQLKKRSTAGEIKGIHLLASEWYERNNFISEAIEHSLKAKNSDRAIAIIEENWEDTFDKDLWYLVDRWMSFIPEDDLVRSVNLLLARLWIFQKRHMVLEIPEQIKLIEQRKSELSNKGKGYLSFAKCMIHLFAGDIQKALEYAENALQLIPKTHYIFRADTYGWWTVAMQASGRGEEAVRAAQEAMENIDPPGEPIQSARRTMHPNFVYMSNADLFAVKRNIETFFALPDISPYILAFGWYFKASACWWSNDMEGAIKGFEQLLDFKYQCRPRIVIEAYICLAIALQELNRAKESDKAMNSGLEFAKYTKDLVNINIIKSGQIRLKLMRGELGTAEKWLLETKHDRLDVSMLWWIEVSAITQSRVLIATNTIESLGQAIQLLKNHKEFSESVFNKLRTIEILVLQARASLKLKLEKDAKDALKYALELAAKGLVIRPFVEGGADLKDLLLQLKDQGVMDDFIDLILANIKKSPDASIQRKEHLKQIHEQKYSDQYVAFTRKEMEILQCVSEGFRNQEIADKLFNSQQTIKKHLSNMFQKIQVRNRMAMIKRAKELGLLE